MQRKHTQDSSLLALERTLKTELHPVEPNQRFVQTLRTRLEDSSILYRQRRIAATLLTIAGGLLVGTVIFLIGRGFLRNSSES